ncbi:MAG: ParA family protein [Oscillospiraceae bacterium]
MGKIIAIASQKGGVGKTTSTVNLAASLGVLKKKILLIDIDPQGNATSGVGVNKRELSKSSYHLLTTTIDANEIIVKTEFKNLDIIPSNIQLAGAELELVDAPDRVNILKKSIVGLKEKYDYILIDCPPSLGLITLNALTACDTFLMPIQCEYYALEGVSQLVATVRQVKKMYNNTIEIEGVLLTMFDGRLNLTTQVLQEVKKFFGDKVYKTSIPRNVRLSEAPSFGKPVFYYDKGSTGTKAYLDLANEVIKHNKK